MIPSLASFICACGIVGLFYLDRDKTLRPSKALWLPILWLALVGSRPLSAWFGFAPTGTNQQLEGSPFDAAVFGILSALAVGVLIYRSKRTRAVLVANWPILIYFIFCLISVTWSYHPDIAFKRWIKATGDLWMVLVIVTDPQPVAAFKRLISRLGFVLLPASMLLIKYYGNLGRAYAPNGELMNTGVSTDKNMLGVFLLVISMGTLWQVIGLLRAKRKPGRKRHLIAQGTLLLFGVSLLRMAHSSTAIACFILGGGLIIATSLRSFRNRPARVHALCLAIIAAGAATLLFGGVGSVAHALGRQSTLSGRTEIWAAVIPAAVNSIIGAGFESFWISPNVVKFQQALVGWWHPEYLNEAHNGYIEVYLNLGLVGVGLIAIILIRGYSRATKALRQNWSVAGLMLAYIIAAAVYSITEAGFRMLDPIWIFLLLAVVSSSWTGGGLIKGEAVKASVPLGDKLIRLPLGQQGNAEQEPVNTMLHESPPPKFTRVGNY